VPASLPLGIALALASTFAYNGSAVLLAAAARRRSRGKPLVLEAGRGLHGIGGVVLDAAGWVLEAAALALIPLTLVRVLSAAGLGVLLALSGRMLGEPLGRRKVAGVVLVALGVVAVGITPPRYGGANPPAWEWGVLVALALPITLAYYTLRALKKPASARLSGAVVAGVAFALSGIFTKGAVNLFSAGGAPLLSASPGHPHGLALPLALLGLGLLVSGILAFEAQLKALRHIHASVVTPVVLALHTVLPIIAAPLLFDERWPSSPALRVLLGLGIVLTLAGTLVLSAGGSKHLEVP
jgi:drug/metabolite transporter (DMT)-like permease